MNRPDPPPIQKQNSMIFFPTEKEATTPSVLNGVGFSTQFRRQTSVIIKILYENVI